MFFTTSLVPWQRPAESDAKAEAGASGAAPATGAGAGGAAAAEQLGGRFLEPWGSEVEPAGSYLERLSNLFDYDLSDAGVGTGSDGDVQLEQPDGSFTTLDGSQSKAGEWAVPHMHLWVQDPAPVRELGMMAMRAARYRFRDWLAQCRPDGVTTEDAEGSHLVPKVDDIVAFVRDAMSGVAPRYHSGELSGVPRESGKMKAASEAALGGPSPDADAASGERSKEPATRPKLVELRLPCEDGPFAGLHWHSDELQQHKHSHDDGRGLASAVEEPVEIERHAPGSHWRRMLLAADSMQLLRLLRPMAMPHVDGMPPDQVRHGVLVISLANAKGEDEVCRALNLLQAWVNGRMEPGKQSLQVVVLPVDRNDVDERLQPHVDLVDMRLYLPSGGALRLTDQGLHPIQEESVASAAGYGVEAVYDSARPLGGALGRHGWSCSSAGWVSAGFLEWW